MAMPSWFAHPISRPAVKHDVLTTPEIACGELNAAKFGSPPMRPMANRASQGLGCSTVVTISGCMAGPDGHQKEDRELSL